MRVAGQANRRLAGDQQLGQLRMAFMKLDVVGGDFCASKSIAFSSLLKLILGEGQKHFEIARFGDQAVFPARIDEVLVALGLFFLLNQARCSMRR